MSGTNTNTNTNTLSDQLGNLSLGSNGATTARKAYVPPHVRKMQEQQATAETSSSGNGNGNATGNSNISA
eukprot:jgi/Hompol1/4727/HPOL_001827-RA